MAPAPTPGGEATVGTVAALVEQRPRWRCAQGHDGGPVLGSPAVARHLADAVPVATRRRLGRLDRCAGCGSDLLMPTRRTVWPVTLTSPDRLVAVTLTLDTPATRCPGCGLQQVPSRSGDDLVAAASAAVDPDGAAVDPDA